MILRLYNCEFAQIDLSQNAAIIEAEPQKIFLSMLEDLAISPETPKELSLYEGEKRVKQSDIFLVSDVWNFDICSKALLTKIYKHLEAAVYSDIGERMKLDNLILQVKNSVLQSISSVNIDFDIGEEADVKDVFSMLKVQPLFSAGTTAEKLENFLDICREIKICKLLVLVQARAFLSKEEQERVFRRALANNISLIMLENSHAEGFFPYAKCIYIDKDYCDTLK